MLIVKERKVDISIIEAIRPIEKKTRRELKEEWEKPKNGNLEIRDLCQILLKAFQVSRDEE